MAIKDQENQWNQFIVQNNGSFLQSWQWGEFQKSLNRKIWRIQADNLKALVIKYDLPLGKNYLYCPMGLVTEDNLNSFLEEIKEIAKQEKSIFFKIEPQNKFQISNFKFQTSQKQIQPLKTVILDITKPEQELLSQMHQKTRYNIRLAQKKGVTIQGTMNNEQRTMNKFLELLEQTAKRDKFHLHPRKYYEKMLDVLGKEGMVKLILAKYQNQIIAANLVCFFGQTAIYLYGASDYNSRNLMAPYLLQYQTILQAKELGYKYYDFWGIDEKKWPGVTRFKRGFNGKEITYPGAFDLIFKSSWYRIYNIARKIL